MKMRVTAEWILFLLSTVIHGAILGSVILMALMSLIVWGVAERTGALNDD